MSVTFGTLELQNPSLFNVEENVRRHGLGRAAGGTPYRYSKGANYKRLRIGWTDLREAEKEELDSFFDTMDGPSTDFTFIDHHGVSRTCFFLVDALPWTEVDDQVSTTGTYTVTGAPGCTFPTTTRKEAVFSLEIELEIVS